MAKPSREARKEAGGKSRDGFSLPPHQIYIIGVDTSHGPEHPLYKPDIVTLAQRGEYNDLDLRSIDSEGVIQPVRVVLVRVEAGDTRWPDAARGKNVHVCLAGRHRIWHAREVVQRRYDSGRLKDLADWQVDCILETRTDVGTLTRIARDENLRKREVSPIELGVNAIQETATGVTLEAVAEASGYSVNQLKRFIVIAEQGTDELHDAVRAGMSVSAASRVARLDPDEQRAVLVKTGADSPDHDVLQGIDEIKGKPVRIKPPTPKRWKKAAKRVADQAKNGNDPVWSDREMELFGLITGTISLDETSDAIRSLFADVEGA